MATRRPRRPQERSQSRVSIILDSDTHRRLRSLSVLREASIQDIVASLIEDAVRQVRLPSVGPLGSTEPPGDAA
jgi:hypothetical protein